MVSGDSNEQQVLFPKGVEVEVTSDEEGFKGAWYRAHILESVSKSSSKKRKKPVVEYKALVTEDGSGPLTEQVELSYIRPLPPQTENSRESFDVDDIVDAFYRDGWWTGTVRKILEDGRFRVYFDHPPDIIEFEAKDLRSHWDWVDGKWVRPEKQKSTGSDFSSGKDVEVTTYNGEIFRDTWFPAIVIKEFEDKTYLVRYLNSRSGDEAGAVKLTVDSQHIRPTPPRYLDRSYKLLEKVDVLCGMGWRSGVVNKILTEGRYNVYFKHENEAKEFNQSDVRPHVKWSNGNWVSDSKEVLVTSDNREQPLPHDATVNMELDPKVESSGTVKVVNKNMKPCSTNVKDNSNEASTPGREDSASCALPQNKRKMKSLNSTDSSMYSLPGKKPRENSSHVTPVMLKKLRNDENETNSAMASPKTEGKGMRISEKLPNPKTDGKGARISEKLPNEGNETHSATATSKSEGKGTRISEKHAESPVLGKRIRTIHKKFGVDFQTIDLKRKGRPSKLEIRRPPSIKGNGSDVRIAVAEESKENEGTEKLSETFPIVGSKAKEVGGSQAEDSSLKSDGESLKAIQNIYRNSNDSERETSAQSKNGGSSQRRKRGRPRKLIIISSKAPQDGKQPKEPAAAAVRTNEADLQLHVRVESTVVKDVSGERIAEAEVSKTNCMTKDSDLALAVTSNMAEDDRPLSTWKIGGVASTNTVNGTKGEKKSQNDVVTESSIVCLEAASNGSEPVNNHKLPFLKKSPVWGTIESMEVFQILPQNPHFLPLSETKEEYREGTAIGIMVTFAGLFEKISMLKHSDSKSTFTSTLDSLLDLEKHGFDVSLLRKRVNDLLSIRERLGKLQDNFNDIEKELALHANERAKFDEDCEGLKKKILALQEQLELKRSRNEKKNQEISLLQSRSSTINGQLQGTQREFEKLVAAAWKQL